MGCSMQMSLKVGMPTLTQVQYLTRGSSHCPNQMGRRPCSNKMHLLVGRCQALLGSTHALSSNLFASCVYLSVTLHTVQMPKQQQSMGEEITTALKVPERSLSRVLVEQFDFPDRTQRGMFWMVWP